MQTIATQVVCLEGLIGKLEALQFTFQELPLRNGATPSEPACKPQLRGLDLGSVQPESVTTDIQVPPLHQCYPSLANTVEPPSDITMVINLYLKGAWNGCSRLPPTAMAPVSQCSTLRKEPPLVALGALPSTRETEDPLRPEGSDSSIPAPMATLMQTSPWADTLGDIPSFIYITHPLFQPTMPKTPEAVSTCMFPPRVVPTRLVDKLLPPQEKMNTALECLLANRVTGDLCCKELDLNAELVACLNETQAAEAIKQATMAIKQAEVCHTTTACTLQQAHIDSVIVLKCQMKVEERQDC